MHRGGASSFGEPRFCCSEEDPPRLADNMAFDGMEEAGTGDAVAAAEAARGATVRAAWGVAVVGCEKKARDDASRCTWGDSPDRSAAYCCACDNLLDRSPSFPEAMVEETRDRDPMDDCRAGLSEAAVAVVVAEVLRDNFQ